MWDSYDDVETVPHHVLPRVPYRHDDDATDTDRQRMARFVSCDLGDLTAESQ
jgi:hypothetical protein